MSEVSEWIMGNDILLLLQRDPHFAPLRQPLSVSVSVCVCLSAGLTNHFYTTRSMASYDGLTSLPKFLSVDAVGGTAQGGGAALLELPGGVRGVTKYNHFYVDPTVLVLNHYLTKVLCV